VYDENRVLRRIKEGDRSAFEELVDQYQTRIYRLALRYAGSVQDAEDLTQEVFIGIYRNIGGFRGKSSLSTWIYRVAVNHCLEHRRRKRPEQVPYDENLGLASTSWRDDPSQAATKVELSAEVDRAIEKLSPIHRDVILLHELHGLTYGECAEALGLPIGTVKSRLSNAFTRLRQLLGGYLCEET
jgi:RNA polymerase sigma-70 factor (ECF subfamily)